ncbi:hypothetical protein N4G37_01165 [Enterococcus faecalis]|uniref:hypothetical protein n=1 Tax=Enterococcus faecalis TaxID=1351 RepID=UPI001F53B2DD|nr:hypothetical protein [Enterococcus faecalis]MCI1171887.1 hypothetical protein [Enterococcus faecalis]MCT6644685.1 hypothetical protein [Enterococcus faecalis]
MVNKKCLLGILFISVLFLLFLFFVYKVDESEDYTENDSIIETVKEIEKDRNKKYFETLSVSREGIATKEDLEAYLWVPNGSGEVNSFQKGIRKQGVYPEKYHKDPIITSDYDLIDGIYTEKGDPSKYKVSWKKGYIFFEPIDELANKKEREKIFYPARLIDEEK